MHVSQKCVKEQKVDPIRSRRTKDLHTHTYKKTETEMRTDERLMVTP